MIFHSEAFWMLELIKNKDAEALFNAEAFVSQWNFGNYYLTSISNNTIPNTQVVHITFSWKPDCFWELWSQVWIFQGCYSP